MRVGMPMVTALAAGLVLAAATSRLGQAPAAARVELVEMALSGAPSADTAPSDPELSDDPVNDSDGSGLEISDDPLEPHEPSDPEISDEP